MPNVVSPSKNLICETIELQKRDREQDKQGVQTSDSKELLGGDSSEREWERWVVSERHTELGGCWREIYLYLLTPVLDALILFGSFGPHLAVLRI